MRSSGTTQFGTESKLFNEFKSSCTVQASGTVVPTLRGALVEGGFRDADSFSLTTTNTSHKVIANFSIDGVCDAKHGHDGISEMQAMEGTSEPRVEIMGIIPSWTSKNKKQLAAFNKSVKVIDNIDLLFPVGKPFEGIKWSSPNTVQNIFLVICRIAKSMNAQAAPGNSSSVSWVFAWVLRKGVEQGPDPVFRHKFQRLRVQSRVLGKKRVDIGGKRRICPGVGESSCQLRHWLRSIFDRGLTLSILRSENSWSGMHGEYVSKTK
ncbi:hypothetical protein HG530_009213 [Fusarium avenaceum]|nr:hypothetical protein HG530_009213 [Fusarium avenaceum]